MAAPTIRKKKKTGASHGNFLKPEEEDSAHRWMAQYHSSRLVTSLYMIIDIQAGISGF